MEMDEFEGVPYWSLELKKNKTVDYDYSTKLSTQIDLAEFGMKVFDLESQPEEICGLILLNGNQYPIGVFKVSHGSLDEIITQPRAIFKRVLMCNAIRFAVIHNHPAGDPELSGEDMQVYLTLNEAAKRLGLECLDLIATGVDGTFRSAAEEQARIDNEISEIMESTGSSRDEVVHGLSESFSN